MFLMNVSIEMYKYSGWTYQLEALYPTSVHILSVISKKHLSYTRPNPKKPTTH